MTIVNQILAACRPLIGFVSLLFGVIAAYAALIELVPILGQIGLRPRGQAQSYAIVGACLALIGGRA